MAINRFYRSSAPRYTSQFIEDKYPEQLIMQAGAMKYAQQQQFAKDVGEIEGLAKSMPYGYRSSQLALGNPGDPIRGVPPQEGVIKKWSNRVNEYKNKFATTYDTQQAVVELSRLKAEFENDPARMLMKMDYEQGNKQRNEMLRATKTYHTDIDPNVVDIGGTRMLKQFNANDPYTPYDSLVQTADYEEEYAKKYKEIETSKSPVFGERKYTNALGEEAMLTVQGSDEFRDPQQISSTTKALIKNVLSGSTPEGLYHRESLKRRLGKDDLTIQDIYNDIAPIENRALVNRQDRRYSSTTPKGGSGSSDDESKAVRMHLEMADLPSGVTGISLKEFSGRQLQHLFGKEDAYGNASENERNIHSRLMSEQKGYSKLDEKEQFKARKQFVKDKLSEKHSIDIYAHGNDAADELNKMLGTAAIKDDIVTEEGAASLIRGARLIDYDTGIEIIDPDEKQEALMQKDKQFRVLGKVTEKYIANQAVPGGIVIESTIGGSKRYIIQSPELADAQKFAYNFWGEERATATGMGPTFAIQFGLGGSDRETPILNYTDYTDMGNNFDESKVQVKNDMGDVLYFKPVKDYSDNGNKTIMVFAANPVGVGEKEGEDGIMDRTNPLFLKEYKLKDYRGNMNDLYNAIKADVYNDKESLLIKKIEKIQAAINQ